jgi:hypothetical protein
MPLPSASILNNLNSPGARASFGTVAQEETIDKTIPPNNIPISAGRIEVTFFCYLCLSFFVTSVILVSHAILRVRGSKMVAEIKKGIKRFRLIP